MSHDLYPYPTKLGDAGTVVYQALRGEPTDKECLFHAGWHVLGFGMGMVMPDEHSPPLPPPSVTGEMTKEKAAQVLEDCCKEEKAANERKKMQAFPWAALITFLGPIVLNWLKDRLTDGTP